MKYELPEPAIRSGVYVGPRITTTEDYFTESQMQAAFEAGRLAPPVGCRLVPIDPTVEMIDAGYGVVEDTKGVIKATYRAMCAAAPIYMAKTKHGEKCHFGNKSTAVAWAGSDGVVNEVKK